MAAFTIRYRVRFGDVDHARIVYYPSFFDYFHMCFEDFFSSGIEGVDDYRDIMDRQNIAFPTVHAESDFKSPLRFGDRFRVEMRCAKLGTKSVTLAFEAWREEGDFELLASAQVVVCTVATDSLEPMVLPDFVRDAFAALS